MTAMTQTRFATASVVGTGMMGPGIGLALAMGGIRTTLLSRTAEGTAQGLEKARAQGRVLTDNELAGTADVEHAIELLDGSTDFDVYCRCGLVVESGPEVWRGSRALRAWTLWRRMPCWHPHLGPEHYGDCRSLHAPRARDDALLESAAPHATGGNCPGREDVGRGGTRHS